MRNEYYYHIQAASYIIPTGLKDTTARRGNLGTSFGLKIGHLAIFFLSFFIYIFPPVAISYTSKHSNCVPCPSFYIIQGFLEILLYIYVSLGLKRKLATAPAYYPEELVSLPFYTCGGLCNWILLKLKGHGIELNDFARGWNIFWFAITIYNDKWCSSEGIMEYMLKWEGRGGTNVISLHVTDVFAPPFPFCEKARPRRSLLIGQASG